MKKIVLALGALTAMAAAPAMAGDTHFSVGFYSPAPVYRSYHPPVRYYEPVRYVRYEPRPVYYVEQRGRGHKHGHYKHGHDYRGYNTAWNDRYWR